MSLLKKATNYAKVKANFGNKKEQINMENADRSYKTLIKEKLNIGIEVTRLKMLKAHH